MAATVQQQVKMETILKVPHGVKVTETQTSTYWFDADGILNSITKKVPPPTPQEAQVLLDDFKKIAAGRKFCMIGDVTHTVPTDKATRERAAKEIPQFVIAMALVSGSPMGRMLANLFFTLKPPSYPCKMFATEKDAKQWLKQYL